MSDGLRSSSTRLSHWRITPKRAPVIPRVELLDRAGAPAGEALSIELRINELLQRRQGGLVWLCGGPGSGKTTAVEHLAAVLPAGTPLVLRDDGVPLPHHHAIRDGAIVICTCSHPDSPVADGVVAIMRMAPWTRDDVIEYVLSQARASATSVMKRVLGSEGVDRLEGSPELWRTVLDEMIADEGIGEVRGALLSWLRRNVLAWEAACSASMDALRAREGCCGAGVSPAGTAAGTAAPQTLDKQPVLRQPYAQLLLAGQKLASELADVEGCALLDKPLPRDLVAEAGKLVRARPGAIEHLKWIAQGPVPANHATAATILVAAEPDWRPDRGAYLCLAGARLGAVRWSNIRLPASNLRRADLCGGDLSCARLEKAALTGATLSWANLRRAHLCEVIAEGANFAGADLTRVRLDDAMLSGCDMTRARLDQANLPRANLQSVVFSEASLIGAVLKGAALERATFDGADLSSADLRGADLCDVDLSTAASLERAIFREANLCGCNLEGVRLDAPDFYRALLERALLTGSTLTRPNFAGANLRGAGLAEIDWADADLRGADLRAASFHMGTTRSGMVYSDVPCEGSRTGFYTDEFADRDFRAPEEIRKANLCGADLRGANIDGVDFYLVDLRGAKYSPDQADHLARCGAILRDWVA